MKRRRVLRLRRFERRDLPSISIPLSLTNWSEIGPAPVTVGQTPGGQPITGRISGIAVDPADPNTIYVGTAGGGVWKTTNGGATNPTWLPLTDTQASPYIGAITIAPSNHNIIYVGTGEAEQSSLSFYGRGILKSTDAGATWTLLGSAQFDRLTISTIVVSPTDANTLFVAVGGPGVDGDGAKQTGIYRSLDGGQTWNNISTAISTSAGYSDLEPDPSNLNVMYAGVGSRFTNVASGVYKTTNALAASPTWTLVANLPSGANVGRVEVAVAPSNNQVIYVAMASIATQDILGFFSTTDGGVNWADRTAQVPSMGQMWYCDVVLVNPANANDVYFGGSVPLRHSIDNGATFTDIGSGANGIGPHVDHHGFAFDSTGKLLDVSDGGAWRYTPSTNLWVSLNGINQTRTSGGALAVVQFVGIAISPTDPNFVIGGTQDNGTIRTIDGLGWTTQEGGDGGDVTIDPFNPSRMWRANPVASYGSGAFVRRSTNNGTTWSSITTGITNAAAAAFYPPMAADPGTVDRIFLGTNVLNVSTDGGTNWGRLPGDTTTFPFEIRGIGIGPVSTGIIYVSVGPQTGGMPNAGAAPQVFVTTNNGVTWVERTPALNGDFQNIAVDPTNSNIAYVTSANFGAGAHVWRTTNAGVSWTNVTSNLPDSPFYDVVLDPGPTNSSSDDVLYVGGDAGVYRSADLGATWSLFGVGLPTVQVRDLEFSTQTKVLAAGTHGRGVWEILTGTPTVGSIIQGTVFNDLNGNGLQDAGEGGLSGWTVFRDDNNNGVLDVQSPLTFPSSNVPVTLPDLATATSTITISGTGAKIADLNIKLDVTHTYDGDLQIFLTSPAGTKVQLFDNINSNGAGFSNTTFDDEASTVITSGTAPFAGTFQPQQGLNAFDGQGLAGTWTLTFTDVGPGDTGTLNSWSLIVSTGEPSTLTNAAGTFQFLNQPASPPGGYSMRRVLQPGWTNTVPLSGIVPAIVTATQGPVGLKFGQTNIPAKVASVTVNDGSPQRSRVTQLVVAFNSIVNFTGVGSPATAFKLFRTGPGAPSGDPAGLITLTSSGVTNTDHTTVTLSFSGTNTESGSLIDGRYNLQVLATQFGGAGFDGDGNGIAGDNYLVVGDPATAPKLFRLFGDADGNGLVDGVDFGAFRLAFNTNSFIFDFDNSMVVDGTDFGQFRQRFGMVI